jgi:tyrosyl-tRNA synthetase
MKFYEELEARGIVYQVTDPELRDRLNGQRMTVYVGIDPTADSLHIGHLMGILTLRRFQMAGHRVIALVGGATGLIGDPSGKSQERNLLDLSQIHRNVEGISKVVSRFLDFSGSNPAVLVNNLDWFSQINVLEFLRDVGKHFTINYMTAKDSVRSRLEDREHGLSYTEFSYMLLQGYDFQKLHQDFGCQLQLGGADQWGNMTAGTEFIRRKAAAEDRASETIFALTWPLLTKADGTKFGKTESGAVWLTADRTSPYQFYQFLIRTSDDEVMRLLKYLTFLSVSAIGELEQSLKSEPEKREAQSALARELTTLVHGEAEYLKAKVASEALFSQGIGQLDAKTLLEVFAEAPSTDCSWSEAETGLSVIDLLVRTGLSGSKGEAKKDILGGGIYVNNLRVTDVVAQVGLTDLIDRAYLVLRKGKKNQHLVAFRES